MKSWTAQQDFVVIGVTVNHGKYNEWPVDYSNRVFAAINKGVDAKFCRTSSAVSAKSDNVMFIVTDGAYGLSHAADRVKEWTRRYCNRDLKAMIVVHQAMRDNGLEDLIPEDIRFI